MELAAICAEADLNSVEMSQCVNYTCTMHVCVVCSVLIVVCAVLSGRLTLPPPQNFFKAHYGCAAADTAPAASTAQDAPAYRTKLHCFALPAPDPANCILHNDLYNLYTTPYATCTIYTQ